MARRKSSSSTAIGLRDEIYIRQGSQSGKLSCSAAMPSSPLAALTSSLHFPSVTSSPGNISTKPAQLAPVGGHGEAFDLMLPEMPDVL